MRNAASGSHEPAHSPDPEKSGVFLSSCTEAQMWTASCDGMRDGRRNLALGLVVGVGIHFKSSVH